MNVHLGRCHCGNLGYVYETAEAPSIWSVRGCACSFCTGHGARYTSDPQGRVRLEIGDASRVIKYRFASRTVDFLLCASCGTLVAVVLPGERGFCVVNVNVLKPIPDDLAPLQRLSFSEETPEQKRQRRETRWSPLLDSLDDGR